jgi:hypothetical protein
MHACSSISLLVLTFAQGHHEICTFTNLDFYTAAAVAAAAAAAAAAVLLPGRKVSSLTAGADSDSSGSGALAAQGVAAGETTEPCPLGFYYDGKEAIFSCRRCPFGTLTKQTGSETVDDW